MLKNFETVEAMLRDVGEDELADSVRVAGRKRELLVQFGPRMHAVLRGLFDDDVTETEHNFYESDARALLEEIDGLFDYNDIPITDA